MRRILIIDDVRSIKVACEQAFFTHEPGDQIIMVRPFRHDGDKLITDDENIFETLRWNPPFDVIIFDNDLGIDSWTGKVLEGFQILKDFLLAFHEEKAPGRVLSCSANQERRQQIESYFYDWKKVRDEK